MQLETITCNNCGAPLEIPDTANFVSCNHCASQLAIRRTGSTTYTEQLEQIEGNQDEMLDRLERIEREQKLAALDRGWEQAKRDDMITDKNGREHLPTGSGVIFGTVFFVVFVFKIALFGIVWTFIAGAIFPPMALFGIFFVAIAILMGIAGISGGFKACAKSQNYCAARKRYRELRQQIEQS